MSKSHTSPRMGSVYRLSTRSAYLIAAVLLLAHGGLLAWSATRHSPTLNEPGHLVAGISHWKFGRFELYRVNPPLVRMVAALPVIAAGYEEDWSEFHEFTDTRPVFSTGQDFIAANGERSIWLFIIARWACIPMSLAGGLFCFLWSRELWNNNVAGLISLFIWCLEPNILAHAELITPDCAATSFGLGAGYFFWRWLRQPSWKRTFAAGLLLGIAELTKMTWVILFGLWPLLWLFWLWATYGRIAQQENIRSQRSTLRQFTQLTTILLLGLYVLNISYAFDGTFTRLRDFTFISNTLTGEEEPDRPGNRFVDTLLADLPVPVPRQYLLGMDIQRHDFENYDQLSYLRGEWKDGGWWYYYLYGLAVKTPHGAQFLLLLSLFTLFYRQRINRSDAQAPRFESASGRDLVILLAPALAVLALVSSQLEFNHHVRYVLPVLGFTSVLSGITAFWVTPPPRRCASTAERRSTGG